MLYNKIKYNQKIVSENPDKQSRLIHSLLMVADKNIWTYDVEHEKFNILRASKNEILTLDTYLNKTVYWTENNSYVINSLSKSYPNVSSTRKWRPQSIAFDYITEKLYLIDKLSGTLNVVDKNGKHYTMLILDLKDPHDLVLDPVEGLVFIVEFNRSVWLFNLF